MKPAPLSHSDSMMETQLPKQTVLSPLSIFCLGDNEIMVKIKLAALSRQRWTFSKLKGDAPVKANSVS